MKFITLLIMILIFIFINMKLIKLYKSLIIEGHIESCVSKFGRELFSPELDGKDDLNNKLDSENFELSHKFTNNTTNSRIDTDIYNIANNLKRCVGAYPEIFPTDNMIYKGSKISIGELLKSYPHIRNNMRMGQPFNMIYTAKNVIQSWVDDEDIANDDFSQAGAILSKLLDKFKTKLELGDATEFVKNIFDNHLDIKIPIIIKYRNTQDDFIFKAKYFKHFSNKDENELLRIDNRPIEVLAILYPLEFSAKLFDLFELIFNQYTQNTTNFS